MYRRVQARSRGGRWAGLSRRSQPRGDQEQGGALVLGLRVGLLLLQLFPNGGATDIVFMTLFCIAAGTAIAWCCGRCGMPDGRCHNILLFWRRSTAASVFRVGAYFEVSLFCPPFSHSSPSLIGLIASVVSLTHLCVWLSSVFYFRKSCDFLLSWTKSLISESALPSSFKTDDRTEQTEIK